jgi:hypothetical protein
MEKHFDIEKHLREDLELTSPSPDFSKKVMGAIAGTHIAPASRSYINKKVVYGTALFFLLLIAGALAYILPSYNWSAAGKFIPPVDLSKLDLSQYFSRKTLNCLLFLNVLLGLVFLDKYFMRRPRVM